MKNFWALYILTIYLNIPKMRLIQIKLCWNASMQMDLSKKNSFLTEEAIHYIARTGKRRYQYVKCLSPLCFCPLLSCKLKRGRSKTPTSSKFELFCQWGNDFLILCFTKSSIIDDVGVRDSTLVCLFPVQNITKKFKI